jgi:ribosomal protein S18 acetylase RimI-like enzyme
MKGPSNEEILTHTFEKWRGLNAEIVDTPHCLYQFSNLPHYFFNRALFKGEKIHTPDQIETVLRPFEERGLSYTCLVPRLLQTQFLNDWFMHHDFAEPIILSTMSINLFNYERPVPNPAIAIREVSSLSDLHLHVRILQEGFFMPEKAASQYLSHIEKYYTKDSCSFSLFNGYLNGRPVACGCLVEGKTYGGIYHIGTIPSARRQGVASEMMGTLLEKTKQTGRSHAILSAMPEAESLYQKIGFSILSTFTNYSPKTSGRKVARTGIEPATPGFSVPFAVKI